MASGIYTGIQIASGHASYWQLKGCLGMQQHTCALPGTRVCDIRASVCAASACAPLVARTPRSMCSGWAFGNASLSACVPLAPPALRSRVQRRPRFCGSVDVVVCAALCGAAAVYAFFGAIVVEALRAIVPMARERVSLEQGRERVRLGQALLCNTQWW